MTPQKKATDDVLLLHAMLLMASADGVMEDEEIELVEGFYNTLPEFRGKDFHELLEHCNKAISKYPNLKESVKALNDIQSPKVKLKAYILAADLAMSSGDVDEAEDQLLDTMQRMFNIPDATAEKILTVLAAKYAPWCILVLATTTQPREAAMAVDPALLQLRRERTLRTRLQDDSGVKKALERLRELMSGWGFGYRRDLLTGALRLSRQMAPDVADSLAACREVLGFDRPVEIYVRPDPHINASCSKNPTGPVLVVLSSRLIEVFTPAEFRFVIGHEIGHAVYDHFAIPMPHTAKVEDLAGPIVSRKTALDLYLWCRAADLGADRVGIICAQDPEAAAAADGVVEPTEAAEMHRIAAALGVDAQAVEQTLQGAASPMD